MAAEGMWVSVKGRKAGHVCTETVWVGMERRVTASIVADMVGYSGLMKPDEVGTLAAQKPMDPRRLTR